MMAAGASGDLLGSLSNSVSTLASLGPSIELMKAQKQYYHNQLALDKASFQIWADNATPAQRFQNNIKAGFDVHSALQLAGANVTRWQGGRVAPITQHSFNRVNANSPHPSSFSAWRQVHDTFVNGTSTNFLNQKFGVSGVTTTQTHL